jgi:hypothetical protein
MHSRAEARVDPPSALLVSFNVVQLLSVMVRNPYPVLFNYELRGFDGVRL